MSASALALIQNPILLGNRILSSLSELNVSISAIRDQADLRLIMDRISQGVPITQEDAARILGLKPTQVERLIRVCRKHGVTVPRTPISRREYRWDSRRLYVWLEVAGRLSADQAPEDIPAPLMDALNAGPGPYRTTDEE